MLYYCDLYLFLQPLIWKKRVGYLHPHSSLPLPSLPLPLLTPPSITCHTLLPLLPHLLTNSQWPNIPLDLLQPKIHPLLTPTLCQEQFVDHMIKVVTSHAGHVIEMKTLKKTQKLPDLKHN